MLESSSNTASFLDAGLYFFLRNGPGDRRRRKRSTQSAASPDVPPGDGIDVVISVVVVVFAAEASLPGGKGCWSFDVGNVMADNRRATGLGPRRSLLGRLFVSVKASAMSESGEGVDDQVIKESVVSEAALGSEEIELRQYLSGEEVGRPLFSDAAMFLELARLEDFRWFPRIEEGLQRGGVGPEVQWGILPVVGDAAIRELREFRPPS